MAFTGAADRVDVSGGFGQGETRPQAFTGLNGKGYLIGRTQDRIIEIADISDPDTSTYVSAIIGNPNSMAAHNGSLYVFIGQDLIRFDTPFSDTGTGTDVFTINETPRALTSDGTNLYYIHQLSVLNFLYRIDDLDGTPNVVALGRVGSGNANIRGLSWHDGFFWGVDATTDKLVKITLTEDSDDPHTVENVGSYSQFVGPITNPQGFGVVNGVAYIAALDNDGSLWELRDFKFTDTIADQSWTVGTAVSLSAPATEDGETPITYAISPAVPAGMTFDTSDGSIGGTPTAVSTETEYTITATDDNGIETTTTFSASVAASGGAVNNAPSFQDASYSFTDVAIAVNTVVGTVAATDADDDTLSYSLTGTDASNFSIDSDGEITVATALTNSTTYNFNVVADDQTDTTSVAVTVVAIAAAVTPTLGWEVPSETVGNIFSATLTSNVALDAAPTVDDLRLRDDDNSDPVVTLNSANTTITVVSGTNNYLVEVELTGTYDDDYTIRINGNTVEYNGAYVNASQLASAVFSIDSSVGANNAPSFSESSYAFTDVAIAVGTVVGTVAATDADNDTLSYSLTGTDASNFSIDSDGEITVAIALTNSTTYNFNVVADDQTDTTSVAVTVIAVAAAVVNNAPSFSQSSYAFTDVAIAVNTVVGTVAATDADNDTLSYSLTGTDASDFAIDSDGEITVAVELTNSDSYSLNVVADDGTDTTSVAVTITAVAATLSFGIETISNQSWVVGTSVNVSLPEATGGTGAIVYSLTPTLPQGTAFNASTRALGGIPTTVFVSTTFTYTATDEDGNTVELTFTLAVAVAPPSLHNTFIFRDCVNYRNNGARVAEHGNASNIIRAVADNDRETFSTETDYAVDIAVDSLPTRVDAFYLVSKGVDTHAGTPTGGTGTGWTARTVPASVDNIRGESVSTVVDGLQYDLFLLDTHFTAESVRLQFTGTGIEIYEVMLLEIVQEINATYSDFLGYAAEQVNRTGRVERSPIGGLSVVDSTREKRDVEMTVYIRPSGRTLIQSPDEFLYLLEANPRLTLAESFSENPSFLYPAIVGSLEIPVPYHSSYKPLGYDMTILIRER